MKQFNLSLNPNKYSGVYFLCSNYDVVYVGSALSINNRIRSHKKTKVFDSVYVIKTNNTAIEEEGRSMFVRKPCGT